MFLKTLTLSSGPKVIREIKFRKGINLIVDESEGQITGNNVGKTTVLKLIDFCFGADKKIIWEDPESKKQVYKLVKDYLIENEVLVTLVLTENLDNEDANEITIERNFLYRSNIIRKINGENFTEEEFELKLRELIFPEHTAEKPSFRQIISHNIRYKDISLSNTLKTLDKFTSEAEYETLYLFLLGCEFDRGNKKQEILEKIRQEENYKKRLERVQTKSAYEAALSLINDEISELQDKKSNLNINENHEEELEQLNQLKFQINKLTSEISKLKIRRDLIYETKEELTSKKSDIDIKQLEFIYEQATNKIDTIQKSFEDLVEYHNQMIEEKSKFITKELPELEQNIKQKENNLNELLKKESHLSKSISKSDSFEELEMLMQKLNEKYRSKGEYENIIQQLNEVESNIENYKNKLQNIDAELFSDDFEKTVKKQVNKFNKHFAAVSEFLYNEKYALKYDITTNSKGQRLYKFSAFNLNFSSGKKQGEITCFDLAYTLFADEENIPCMHFLLNDKKELMDDKQLVKIAELVKKNNIQFVASILKDKLPDELNNEAYFTIKLSQGDKLFRIPED